MSTVEDAGVIRGRGLLEGGGPSRCAAEQVSSSSPVLLKISLHSGALAFN